jgi:hypothetical protein
MTRTPPRLLPLVALCALALAPAVQAQTKAPKVQLWMDLSTGGMAGLPEMPGAGGLGGLFGGGAAAAMGGGAQAYGAARGMNVMPPRVLDIALHNSLKPGVEAQQFVPAGLRLGESLPLVPPAAQPAADREPGELSPEMQREAPKGRVLVYWGCGDTVRRGQPRVIDLARGNPAELGRAFSGRYAADRGARVGPQHALYPNERVRQQVPAGASLVGEHRVQGEGVPASMKFALGDAQNLMPPIQLATRGQASESIGLSWPAVPHARAYYLHAMAQVGNDTVMWSSAETGDTGMGLFDYLPNATIDRWVKEQVLLKPETTSCAVPRGIFAGEGAGREGSSPMVRMVAYGSETNLVHPPRPADARAPWEPEWAVRVRVKANTMAMLGGEQQARGGLAVPSGEASTVPPAAAANPVQGVLDAVVPGAAGSVLRGLFGR